MVMKMINNEERLKNTSVGKYKEIFGVEKQVFDRMLKILNTTYAFTKTESKSTKVGRKPKLSVLDCLVITLMYWREYRTFRHIAYDYGVGKSSVGRAILWVEDTLIASGMFNLRSKRELRENLSKIKVVVIDVTEQEIERPKRGRKNGIQERKSDIQ
jgi:hypothetical protein